MRRRPSISASSSRARIGRVWLVGAGPGDPELLTLRAVRALEQADLVLYDALIDPRVLGYAPRAQRFCVGKRAGKASVAQETTHALMIRAALAGKRVVRLKAGDPFVLGRGGEEVLALGHAGVPVEVVPGLSSAIAGPQAAGIPVTHRAMAQGFLVVSAVPEEAFFRIVPASPPAGLTVVVLMGLGARAAIAGGLTARGWPSSHPAAVVLGAHTPRQWSWTGALGELAPLALPADRADLPGIVVLGDVAHLGPRIASATSGFSLSNVEQRHGTA
jgi:uroporphyrin-III C-methyltransferase